ncbi:MAG TPA: hypothetical protein VFR78_07710 [Pyrinomonadaceae bacterium]|nr:hypothetical protein [Pyrinomonadaceae bacterium]
MRLFILSMFVVLFLVSHAAGQTPRISADDFRVLAGARWTGTLVYRDYGSNKEVSIRANLVVTRDGSSWVFEYEYPDEPKANSRRTVTLSDGGTQIDDEKVVERTSLDHGAVRIVTERRGTDNDRAAIFRYTYLIDASSFSIRKEVRPEGATEFFERNRYSWKR